jgi:SM-20-related protein
MTDSIHITLLLSNGSEPTLSLPADAPQIEALRQILSKSPAAPALVELSTPDGALLSLPAAAIVGVRTRPALSMQLAVTLPALTVQAKASAGPVGTAEPGVPDGIVPVHAVQVRDVLDADEHAALLSMVAQQAAHFAGTRTSTGVINYRESMVLYHFAPFDELLRDKVRGLMPQVCEALKIPVATGAIEAQLTAHNDGNFYKVHNDNGSADTVHRALTFVYYFHRQPKGFSGGELRIYDHKNQNGYHYAADSYSTIEPLDNSMVLFESREMHEVLPVTCPSQQFMDSRFTINGWVAKS